MKKVLLIIIILSAALSAQTPYDPVTETDYYRLRFWRIPETVFVHDSTAIEPGQTVSIMFTAPLIRGELSPAPAFTVHLDSVDLIISNNEVNYSGNAQATVYKVLVLMPGKYEFSIKIYDKAGLFSQWADPVKFIVQAKPLHPGLPVIIYLKI